MALCFRRQCHDCGAFDDGAGEASGRKSSRINVETVGPHFWRAHRSMTVHDKHSKRRFRAEEVLHVSKVDPSLLDLQRERLDEFLRVQTESPRTERIAAANSGTRDGQLISLGQAPPRALFVRVRQG